MTALLTGAVSLLVFGAVILVHELGHFLAARYCGIRVEEFSVGFGPALFSKQIGATRYSLRMIPLGGYNLFAAPPKPEEPPDEAETPEQSDQPEPARPIFPPEPPEPNKELFPCVVANRDYEEATAWQRFFVTASGALMNFVLGLAVLVILVCSYPQGTTTVEDFFPDATSSAALQVGDTILQVDGEKADTLRKMAAHFTGTAPAAYDLTVLRDGKVITLPAVTVSPVRDEDGELYNVIDFYVKRAAATPRNVLKSAGEMFGYYSTAILDGFRTLVTDRNGASQLSGPIGVVSAVGQAVSYGWQDVLSLMAMLTINLGIFNLLPIPALDGCKLLFCTFEGVTGRRVPQRVQIIVNTVGMVALLWLMLFVTMQDIGRFFG